MAFGSKKKKLIGKFVNQIHYHQVMVVDECSDEEGNPDYYRGMVAGLEWGLAQLDPYAIPEPIKFIFEDDNDTYLSSPLFESAEA